MSKIKERLKEAYNNVIYYADKTWVENFHMYQKANQELYAREIKIRDSLMEESNRPRTVQDCIPTSKLAKYSNYEYNESRELSYASNVSSVSFYYPCTFKRDSIKEPWMLPEIEQLFIWLTYSCDFNLLDPIAIEELNHLDEQDKIESGFKENCCNGDFHQINPYFYETFDRTPGKPCYTTVNNLLTDDEVPIFSLPLLQVHSFDDMILRMNIKSEKVQNIWNEGNAPQKKCVSHDNTVLSSEKKLNIFKSPLGNFFIFENARNIRNIPNLERFEVIADEAVSEKISEVNDFTHLQNLTESFSSLQAWVLSASAKNIPVPQPEHANSEKEELDKTEIQPTRRLYSAVLQGLSPPKIAPIPSENTSSSSNYTNISQEISLTSKPSTSPRTNCSSCFSNDIPLTSRKTPVTTQKNTVYTPSISTWQNQTNWTNSNAQSSKLLGPVQIDQITKPSVLPSPQTNFISAKSKTPPTVDCWSKHTCGSTVLNTNTCTSVFSNCSYTNSLHSSNITFSNNFANTYGTNTFSNNFTSNNYAFNLCSNNFSTSSYANSAISYTFSNNIYSNNQISSARTSPQLSRQTYSPPPMQLNPPPPIWVLQQHRATAVYPVPHYPPPHYLYIPPPTTRSSQRWTSSYLRPPSTPSQSYPVPITPPPPATPPQNWGTQSQSLYRTNSNQVLTNSTQQSYENTTNLQCPARLKTKKKTAQSHISLMQCKVRNKTALENETDFNDFLFDSCPKEKPSKKSYCTSDIGISIPSNEKMVLLKSTTSSSSLECNCLKRQISLSKLSASKRRLSEPILLENDCELNRVPLTSTLSEDLERQALEQYQGSNDNFYQELERQAAEQCNEFSENLISPPSRASFGGLNIKNLKLISHHCLYILLTMYIDINVCNYCFFLLS